MGFFSRERGPKPEPPSEKPKSVPESGMRAKVTREVAPAELGGIKPRRRLDERGTELHLPDAVFVGSKRRQEMVETHSGDIKIAHGELHVAELTTEILAPGTDRVTARRTYVYVQTPDGRLHSSRAVLDVLDAADMRRVGYKQAVEERMIDAAGRVNGTVRTEIGFGDVRQVSAEKITYDKDGNVFSREQTLTVDGKEVRKTETRLNTQSPRETVLLTRMETRPDKQDDPTARAGSKQVRKNGDDFQNPFYSQNLQLMEE